jgi:hypothetical protein
VPPLQQLSDTGSTRTKLSNTTSLTKLGNRNEGFTKLGRNFTIGDKVGGFALSAVESFPELFGIEPSQSTQEFRAAAPVSGFLSQAVGAFVPYLGAAKAARAAPVVGGAIEAFGGLEALGGGSAIARGARIAAAEAAAVEAGRLGISATPLPEAAYEATTGREAELRPFGTLVGEAALNVGGSGVLGGAVGGIAARLAKPARIEDLVPLAASDQPLAVQVRELNEAVARAADPADPFILSPETIERLGRERDQRLRFNLMDVEPTYTDTGETLRGTYRQELGRVYRPLVGQTKSNPIDTFLNRANNWRSKSPDKLTATRRLIYDPTEAGGYRSEEELAADLAAIGKSREELGLYAQDIKTIEVRPGQGKKLGTPTQEPLAASDVASMSPEQAVGRRLLEQPQEWNTTKDVLLGRARGLQRRFNNSKVFRDVGDGWGLAREQDGLYVMRKKIQGGAEAAPGDRWVFFRTDRPDVFAPKAARTNELFMKSQYLPAPIEEQIIGEPIFDSGSAFLKMTKDQPTRKVSGTKSGVVSAAKESAESAANIVAPTAPLGTRNPILNRAFQYLKNLESVVEARVTNVLYGADKFDDSKSLLKNVLFHTPKSEALMANINRLTPKDLTDIRFVLESELPFDRVLEANARFDINGEKLISDQAKDFLQAMQLISDNFTQRVSKLQATVQDQGVMKLVAEFQARKGHYAMTRDFPGSYRVFLMEKGEVVGIATGDSPAAAREAAMDIITQQGKRGRVITEGGMVDDALRDPVEIQKLKAKVLKPGFLKNRGDLLGYELQRGELTNKKLGELVEKNLRRRENYIRNVTMYEQLAETLATLNRQRPQDAQALERVMQRMMGNEGEFARVQNAAMDKVLHAVGFSGKDSASSIVRVTQKLLTSFQFNFGNLTQPILNMVGTFQTILPEISYVLHASPETLARNYVSVPLLDGRNSVKGTMGILSEWKLFGNAMQRMGVRWKDQPDDFKGLVEEMVRQRQLAPRFAEEQFGVDGAILRDPLAAFKSGSSFVDYFEAANGLLISKSEELNRMMVVNSAYELAKVMDLPFDRMVNFTREMMGKTAFNYGTADRATVFTTPLGSLAGTFKNWMFHYMANMIKYASGGKETLPALFWQTAATAVIGGSAATPFVMPIANGASKFLTDKSAMENLYAMTGGDGLDERVADGVMYGLPGALGLSFASQAASPGSDPARDASMMFSFAAFDRGKALSTATKDALVAYKVSGEGPWEDELVRGELVRALAPRTFYRAMALTQDHAVRSLSTGYDVAHLGLGGSLLYGAGFNPTELEKTYEVYNEIRNDQRRQKEAVAELGQTLAQAWESGDDRLANRTFTRAMAIGVDTSSVLRSAQARQKRAMETQLEFTASDEDRSRYEFMFEDETAEP